MLDDDDNNADGDDGVFCFAFCQEGGGDCGPQLRLLGMLRVQLRMFIVLWRLGYRPFSAWSKNIQHVLRDHFLETPWEPPPKGIRYQLKSSIRLLEMK